jgi:tripartite-type tricarboxylate transporter receptor subunit TctC
MARADELCSGECHQRVHARLPTRYARALLEWPRWPLASLASAARAARWLPSAALAAAAVTSASAQSYPSRPVELVVPFPAGGGAEIVTRHLSDGLAKRLGQPFVVLNRPGANTNLATHAVVRSAPDGYTLLIASFGLAANPSLYKKLGFEPQTDLEPITLIANSPTVLAVPMSLPVSSLSEFIAYVKARPGELNYGSYGVGSSPHLGAGLFMSMTGTKMVHVPYGGGGPAAVGLMTNQVQALFSSVVPVLGMLRGGTLKAIAIAADRRSELLPNLPTFKEQGLDYQTGTWYGLFTPAKTPPAIIETLHRASVSVLADPGVRARIAEQGAEVVASSPSQLRAFVKDETERLARVIREANIQID